MINQHIHEFLNYYIEKIDKPEYAVLLSGKWGSGKTFFINQVTEKYQNTKNIVKVSLFGLKSKEDIHKQVLLKLFNIDDTHDVTVTARLVGQVLKKFTGINLSDMPMGWALKQEGNQNAIFIFDDLERAGIELLELHGYINGLTETHKQKVILLADEDKLKEDEKYILFKEKTVGKTFGIEQDFETAFKIFTDEMKNAKEVLNSNQSIIKSVFDAAGYQNLRSLRQTMLDFDYLINNFESKFKTHVVLMTEIIQIFFAFSIEMKSGKLDIQMLEDMTILPTDWMVNEEESDEELTHIEKIFQKYNFLFYELLLANESWIELFTLGILSSERISLDLNRSRFFKEQQEEWVTLGHYLYIEQSEFEKVLQETLKKLEDNKYDDPIVLMHIASTLLHLGRKFIYDKTEENIVIDMQKYISRNIAQWKNIDTLDHHKLEKYHLGFPPLKDMSPAYVEVQKYLLKKAEDVKINGLKEKGNLLVTCLNENKIQEFTSMLSAESNKEVLYRLPVFNEIKPQDFFDALLQVENKNIRDVLDILRNRYQSIVVYQKESVLEELDFWKAFIDIVNLYEVKNPRTIKNIWINEYCHNIIEKEIILRIEEEIEFKKLAE
jgi:hypothetical protein